MAIRLRNVVKFPARVIAEKGVGLELINGTYRFALDYSGLTLSDTPPGSALVAYIDPDTGLLGSAKLTDILNFSDNLTSISAAETAADKVGYWTGSGSYGLADFTPFARTLVDDVDASTARATLGVSIGSNVQAYSVNLDGFSSKTAPTGSVVGTSDTQTLTNKTISGADNSLTVRVADLSATGTPSSTTALFGDGTWKTPAGAGDMVKASYDPNNVGADAFDLANMATFTRADALSKSIPAPVQMIVTSGYAATGDLGGGQYKRVVSEPSHEGKFQTADGAWWELDTFTPNPHQFGAKGDYDYGSHTGTDDTSAVQNCISYAYTRKGTVHLFHRNYMVDQIVLGDTQPNYLTADTGVSFKGVSFASDYSPYHEATLVLKPGSNKSLIKQLPSGPAPIFERIIFDGNKSQQTGGTSHCYECVDQSTLYPNEIYKGAHFNFCGFLNGRNSGLWIGTNRAEGTMTRCIIASCGTTTSDRGLSIDSYDWDFLQCHIGGCSGYGVYMNQADQVHFTDVNSYYNNIGVAVGAGVLSFSWVGGSVDRNQTHGVLSVKSTVSFRGARTFVGIRFLGNSQAGDHLGVDFYCNDGDDRTSLIGCCFMGAVGATYKAAFAIAFDDTSSKAKVIGCSFTNDYYYGVVKNPQCIVLCDDPLITGTTDAATVQGGLGVRGAINFTPGSSVSPANNGDVMFEFTSNTQLTVRAKGSDGTVRSGTIALS